MSGPGLRTLERWWRLAALAMALVAVMGCGGGSTANDNTLALMLPPGEMEFWAPIAALFETAHPGVTVDLIEGPQSTDLRENLYTTALLAGDPTYDLVYMDVTWTAKFASLGWLRALDDSITAGELQRFLPAALGAGMFEGRTDGSLFRIPVRTDVGLLYYREDWLAAAGIDPPQTFDDLVAAARALQSPPERWGFVWQGKQYEGLICGFLEVLEGHGGFWVDPSSLEVGLDRDEAVEAVRFLMRCIGEFGISPPGVSTYTEEESRRLFQDGRAVFLRNWPYVWRLAQEDGSPLQGKIGVTSMVHRRGQRSAGTLGGWGLGISKFSTKPALAMAFIRHATTLESQRALCAPTGYAPAVLEAYEDDVLLAANPFLPELLEIHSKATPRPVIAGYAKTSDILQRHLSAALAGAARPEDAMRAAAAETRAVLRDPHAGNASR